MSYTLLLADDSVTTQRVLELTFAEHGVRVVGVPDGEQALERLKSEKADIVLADIGLAKVNGYDLAARMKQQPALASVPVLLLTGAFDTIDEERVKQSGAAGTLVKPLESAFVIKRVKELLGLGGTGPVDTPGRFVTAAEPPPMRPPAAPRGVGPPPPRPVPPPRDAHIPVPQSAWDQLREESGLAADVAHVEGQSSGGDDYFDRLDAAFDSLDAQLAGRAAKGVARPAPIPAVAPPAPAPIPAVTPPPPVQTPLAAPVEEVAAVPTADWFADAIAPPTPDFKTTMPSASPVADAFESLLAAEQGEVQPQTVPMIEITEDVIERIAIRVAERLTQGILLDKVTDIVSAATERLVKEEIARIRAAAEARKR